MNPSSKNPPKSWKTSKYVFITLKKKDTQIIFREKKPPWKSQKKKIYIYIIYIYIKQSQKGKVLWSIRFHPSIFFFRSPLGSPTPPRRRTGTCNLTNFEGRETKMGGMEPRHTTKIMVLKASTQKPYQKKNTSIPQNPWNLKIETATELYLLLNFLDPFFLRDLFQRLKSCWQF